MQTYKHLGLHLTFNLDWSVHVHNVCLKAYRKLAVLRSVKLLKRHTLDLLYKLTVRSCIDYALPVFYHSLKVTDKAKLAKIQYIAGNILSGSLHCTSKERLNTELAWESIEKRADFLGLSIFHKIATGKTRPLIRECLPKRKINPDTLRSGSFHQFPYKGEKYARSFFPFYTKKYNSLDLKTRSLYIDDFKEKLSLQIKPQKFKHFSYGYSKRGNTLLTHIRIGYSYLKAHSFSTGHATTNICSNSNNNKQESSLHFLIQCPHFARLRETLFNQMEQNFFPN